MSSGNYNKTKTSNDENPNDSDEYVSVGLYIGPNTISNDKKGLLIKYTNNKIDYLCESNLIHEVKIKTHDLDIIIEEFKTIDEQIKQIKDENEVRELIETKIQLLRKNKIVPECFSFKNISKSLEVLSDLYKEIFQKKDILPGFQSEKLLNSNNSNDVIQNSLLLPNPSLGIINVYSSFSFLANVLPSRTVFMKDIHDLDGDGITNENLLNASIVNHPISLPMLGSLIGSGDYNYTLTVARAIGIYWLNFLILPGLSTFAYFWCLLNLGGDDLVNCGQWMLGSQITFSGPGLVISITIAIKNDAKSIQYTLLDVGLLASGINFVSSIWWKENQIDE